MDNVIIVQLCNALLYILNDTNTILSEEATKRINDAIETINKKEV